MADEGINLSDQHRLLEVIAYQAEVSGPEEDPDRTMQLAGTRISPAR